MSYDHLVQRFPLNTEGRDFAVGDIHGEYHVLDEALARLNFDSARDRLFCVGDHVDRGFDSAACLKFLKRPNVYSVRGNHEDLFFDIVEKDVVHWDKLEPRWDAREQQHILTRYLVNGAQWIKGVPLDRLQEMRETFVRLPIAIEVETSIGKVGIAHADIIGDWENFTQRICQGDELLIKNAMWNRSRVEEKSDAIIGGIARGFVGHTHHDVAPGQYGNVFCIDTGAVYRGPSMYANLYNEKDTLIPDHFMTVVNLTSPAEMIVLPHVGRNYDPINIRDWPLPTTPTARPMNGGPNLPGAAL